MICTFSTNQIQCRARGWFSGVSGKESSTWLRQFIDNVTDYQKHAFQFFPLLVWAPPLQNAPSDTNHGSRSIFFFELFLAKQVAGWQTYKGTEVNSTPLHTLTYTRYARLSHRPFSRRVLPWQSASNISMFCQYHQEWLPEARNEGQYLYEGRVGVVLGVCLEFWLECIFGSKY